MANSNLKNGFLASEPKAQLFGIELAFTTSNIKEDFQTAVEEGAQVLEPLQKKPWGQEVAYLRDLNGFLIELCTPMPE